MVWGLEHIDEFGFEHIEVGNNAVDVIESVVDGISAFRDELISPGELEAYLERKKEEGAKGKQGVTDEDEQSISPNLPTCSACTRPTRDTSGRRTCSTMMT